VKFEEDPPTKLDLAPAEGQEVLIIESDWQGPIIDFIIHNKSHHEKKEHKKLSNMRPATSLSAMSCSNTRLLQGP
jgi:hypothetical protein